MISMSQKCVNQQSTAMDNSSSVPSNTETPVLPGSPVITSHTTITNEPELTQEDFETRLQALLEVPADPDRIRNHKKLFHLLKECNLTILYDKLVECNVDIECMPALTAENFSSFTRNDQKLVGPVARLKTKIETLLSRQDQSSDCNSNGNIKINVEQVLLNDVRGKQIHQFYGKNEKLSEEFQDVLIDVILDYMFSKTTSTVSVNYIEKLVDQICTIFPNENKDEYIIPSTNQSAPTGRFYSRYNNRLRKIRRQGLFPDSTKHVNKKRKLEIEEEIELEELDDFLQGNIEIIKAFDGRNIDMEQIENLWNDTFQYRVKKTKRDKEQDIINDWPILKHPEAYRLIEIDFQKIFADIVKNRRSLIDSWSPLFTKSSNIIFEKLKNEDCIEILGLIKKLQIEEDENENLKNVIFSLALHGVFPPALKGKGGEVYKPSIINSQDSFLLLTTNTDVYNALEKRKQVRVEGNIAEHPYIVGICEINEGVTASSKKKKGNKFIYDIRDIYRVLSFKVVFGSVHFDFDSFLEALEISFKIYKCFNITYPECGKMWCFIDQAFYSVTNVSSSNLASLLNKLK